MKREVELIAEPGERVEVLNHRLSVPRWESATVDICETMWYVVKTESGRRTHKHTNSYQVTIQRGDSATSRTVHLRVNEEAIRKPQPGGEIEG